MLACEYTRIIEDSLNRVSFRRLCQLIRNCGIWRTSPANCQHQHWPRLRWRLALSKAPFLELLLFCRGKTFLYWSILLGTENREMTDNNLKQYCIWILSNSIQILILKQLLYNIIYGNGVSGGSCPVVDNL